MSLTAAGIALSTILLGASPDGRSDLIRFRFGWPASLKADVTMARSRVQTSKPDESISLRFSRQVHREGEEVIIVDRQTRWSGKLPATTSPELIRASERVREVADVNGDFVRIDGVKAVRPALEQVIRRQHVELTKGEIDQKVEIAIWVMRFEAEAVWATTVGFWRDQEMTLGETYRMKVESALPVAPSRRFPFELTYGATQRVPCRAGEKAPRCVEVRLRAQLEPRERARAAPFAAEGLGVNPERIPADAADRLTAESEVTVVTDPATLLPYRLTSLDTVRFREIGPDALTRSFELRREMTFLYGR